MFTSQYRKSADGAADPLEAHVSHNPEVAWRVIDGQAAVVTPSEGTLRMFNETGTFLWQKTEKGARIVTLAKALQKKYGIPAKVAEADVVSFVKKLAAAGMLIISAGKEKSRK
jgi:hypothetical protein